MTNKQIIIDEIDVSGCEWIREVGLDSEYICTCNSPNKTSGYCKYNPNCNYKLYKRKEQECERTKERLESFQKDYSKLYQVVENKGYIKELDQLKAENDQLKEILQKEFITVRATGKEPVLLYKGYELDKLINYKQAIEKVRELCTKHMDSEQIVMAWELLQICDEVKDGSKKN